MSADLVPSLDELDRRIDEAEVTRRYANWLCRHAAILIALGETNEAGSRIDAASDGLEDAGELDPWGMRDLMAGEG